MRKLLDFVIHQSNIRSIYGGIAADAAMAIPTIGLFKRRRVVYPVTDHADGYAFFLKRIDITEFVLGQAVRMYFLNLKLF